MCNDVLNIWKGNSTCLNPKSVMVKCNILILHETLSNIVAILHNYVTLRIFDATLEQGPFFILPKSLWWGCER